MKIHIPEIHITDVTVSSEDGLSALAKVFGDVMLSAIPAAVSAPRPALLVPMALLPTALEVTKTRRAKPARSGRLPAQAELPTTNKAEPEAPRITIRQRIINFIRSKGTVTAPEVTAELVRQGIAIDNGLISQHLYLMTRDEVTVRDDESKSWSLAR